MFVESLVGHWEWCKSTAMRTWGTTPWLPAAVHSRTTLTAQQQCTWGTPRWLPAAMYMGHTTLTASSNVHGAHNINCPAAMYMGHTTLTASSSVHGAHHIDCQQQCTWGTPHWLPAAVYMGHTTLTASSNAQTCVTWGTPHWLPSSCAQMCGTWGTPPWLPAAVHRLQGFISPFPSGLQGLRSLLQICVIPHKILPVLGRWYGKCVQHNQELAHKDKMME